MSDIKCNTQTTFSKDVVEDVSSLQPTIDNIHPTLHGAVEPPANSNNDEYRPDVNILFLGEAGVEKSMFINAFVNYLNFNTLEEAKSGQLVSLVPITFTISDDSFETKVIKFGYESNESQLVEQTATHGDTDYLFDLNGAKIRLIDTPGIEAKNDKDFEETLQYICQFKQLHAICIVGKSKESSGFKNRIEYLVSRFEKTAVNNIIFLFMHSRDTLYRSVDAISVLKNSLEEICSNSSVRVPFEKKNVFCIDSAAFQFLLAVRDKFSYSEIKCNWKLSSEESHRLILYITDSTFQLTPHRIQSTITINEVRRFWKQLAELTINFRQIICDNAVTLETQKHLVSKHKHDRDKLMPKTYGNNVLLCTSESCQEHTHKNSIPIYKLKPCHNPCTCDIQQIDHPYVCRVLGSNGVCSSCRCPNNKHQIFKYESEVCPDQQLDENVKSQITTKEEEIKDAKQAHHNCKKTAKEVKKEVKSFMKLIVKFQYLVNHLNITSCEDEYEEYLLKNLKSLEKSADADNYFKEMLELYKKEKNAVDNYLKYWKTVEGSVVSPAEVENFVSAVDEFHKLPYFGEIIKNSTDIGKLKDALEQWLKIE